MTVLAIVLAACSAGALAYGAHFQHSAVRSVTAGGESGGRRRRLSLAGALPLLRNPRWLLGLLCMGLGTALNVAALSLAPVMVAQPVGTLALIISVMLGVHVRKVRLPRRVVVAVVVCVTGVAVFVITSAVKARSEVHLGADAHPLAWITLALFMLSAIIVLIWRRPPQLILIGVAGALFACVATTVHVVAGQILHGGLADIEWFNVISAAAAGLLGSWLVQVAYASGPPETVIAGLTVVDPVIAVVLGGAVLGEAAGVSLVGLGLMCFSGAAACGGVIMLASYHPDVRFRDRADGEGRLPFADRPG